MESLSGGQSGILFPRHALHASRLTFPHNATTLTVESPLPPDLASLLL